MRRFAAVLLCAVASPAAAQVDYGLSGYIDFRLVSPGDETSWLQGGLGKTRYGNGDSDFQFAAAIGQGYVQLTPEILAVGVLRVEPEQRTAVDALEGYIRYRPVSTSSWRWSVKGGAFFAPFSLENTEVGWSSYWTLTPSAINSWFGDELRTVGAEGTVDWRTSAGTLEWIAAGFGWNDPAGVMIADRGWAMDDRPTGLIDHLRLPDATLVMFGDTPPDSTPIFKEYDGRAGWYTGLSWDDTAHWHLEVEYYDNEADPAAHHGGYFAWRTRFWNAGASWTFDEFTVLSQAMANAKSTDPVKVAWAMEGLKVKSFNGDVEVRKTDHQLQQPLYLTVWQKTDAKHPYSPENTGMTLVPVKEFPSYISSTPTSCQMKRPGAASS